MVWHCWKEREMFWGCETIKKLFLRFEAKTSRIVVGVLSLSLALRAEWDVENVLKLFQPCERVSERENVVSEDTGKIYTLNCFSGRIAFAYSQHFQLHKACQIDAMLFLLV